MASAGFRTADNAADRRTAGVYSPPRTCYASAGNIILFAFRNLSASVNSPDGGVLYASAKVGDGYRSGAGYRLFQSREGRAHHPDGWLSDNVEWERSPRAQFRTVPGFGAAPDSTIQAGRRHRVNRTPCAAPIRGRAPSWPAAGKSQSPAARSIGRRLARAALCPDARDHQRRRHRHRPASAG